MHCSGDFVPSDMKMHSNSSPIKFYRSMSFGDFGQGSLVRHLSTFSKDVFSETSELFS